MKVRNAFAVVLVGLFLIFSGCGKKDEHIQYISKDALSVVGFNVKSLYQKVDLKQLEQNNFFKNLMRRFSSTEGKAIQLNEMGIDLLNTFYVYALPNFDLPTPSSYYAVLPLKNATTFKAFLQAQFKDAKMLESDGVSYAVINPSTCIGWKNKTAIVAFAGVDVMYYKGDNNPTALALENALRKEIAAAFGLKREASILQNEKFVKLSKQNDDVSIWVNYEQILKSLPQDEMGPVGLVLSTQKRLTKDAALAASINFESGKIVANGNYYMNESLAAVMQRLSPKQINNSLVNGLAGNQLNLQLNYHFNPEGLLTLADSMQTLPVALEVLKQFGLSSNDVTGALSGDISAAITDFKVQEESQNYNLGGSTYSYTRPVPNFGFNLLLGIKDKASFEKVLSVLAQQELVTPHAPGVYTIADRFLLKFNDKVAIITDNEQAANTYFTGADNKIKSASVLDNKPFGLFVELENSLKYVPLDLLYGKEDTSVFAQGKKLLSNISAYGGAISNNQSSFQATVLFQNDKENSLMQLLNFLNQVMEAEQKATDSIEEVFPEEDTASVGDFAI